MWSVVHLPLRLQEHGQVDEVVAVPRRERLEQLQPVAVRIDGDLDTAAVGRRRDEAGLAALEAAGRQLLADGLVETEVGDRIAVERAGERVGHHRLRRRHEAQRVGAAVVALGEVAVVRGDDHVDVVGADVVALPLADARAAGVGEHRRADRFEVGEQAVALDGGAHPLGAGSDEQRRLHAQPLAAAWRASDAVRVMSSYDELVQRADQRAADLRAASC